MLMHVPHEVLTVRISARLGPFLAISSPLTNSYTGQQKDALGATEVLDVALITKETALADSAAFGVINK